MSLLFGVPQRVASPAPKRKAFGAWSNVGLSGKSSLLLTWSMVSGVADLALDVNSLGRKRSASRERSG